MTRSKILPTEQRFRSPVTDSTQVPACGMTRVMIAADVAAWIGGSVGGCCGSVFRADTLSLPLSHVPPRNAVTAHERLRSTRMQTRTYIHGICPEICNWQIPRKIMRYLTGQIRSSASCARSGGGRASWARSPTGNRRYMPQARSPNAPRSSFPMRLWQRCIVHCRASFVAVYCSTFVTADMFVRLNIVISWRLSRLL
jgi:hypothetical protein